MPDKLELDFVIYVYNMVAKKVMLKPQKDIQFHLQDKTAQRRLQGQSMHIPQMLHLHSC